MIHVDLITPRATLNEQIPRIDTVNLLVIKYCVSLTESWNQRGLSIFRVLISSFARVWPY